MDQDSRGPLLSRQAYWLMTLGPLLASLAGWGVLALIWPWSKMLHLKAAMAAVWLYAGKFVILFPSLVGKIELTSWELAGLVAWMDTATAILLWANLKFLYRVPWLGPKLVKVRRHSEATMSRSALMRRGAFAGVALFVLFPVAGTGATKATIIAELAGMRTWSMIASVALGAVAGCFALAAFSNVLKKTLEPLKDTLWVDVIGIGVGVILVAWIVWYIRRVDRMEDNQPT
jgi:uncharacterized membrane protein